MSRLPKFLKHHKSSSDPDKFEFKLPNLIPSKKGWKILGLSYLVLVVIFLLYLVLKLILNFQVLSSLDHAQAFTPKAINKDQTLSSLNQIMELPTDQNGTVGIIKNVKALETKADFFKKARNGDILVIYPKMTVIYDPVNHDVVDISNRSLLQ